MVETKHQTVRQTLVEHLGNVTKVRQGKAVIEEQADGGFLVMTPDGEVTMVLAKRDAERRCNRWFKRDLERTVKTTRVEGLVGIGTIEWRWL